MEMGAITPMEVPTERLVMVMTIVTTGIKTMGMGMGSWDANSTRCF